MKKVVIAIRYTGLLCVCIGVIFFILHQKHTGRAFIVFALSTVIINSVIRIFFPDQRNKFLHSPLAQKIWSIVAYSGSALVCLGLLFRILQIDGAQILSVTGLVLVSFFLVAVIFYTLRSKTLGKPTSIETFVALGLTTEELQKFEGTYINEKMPMKMAIKYKEGTLVAQANDQRAFYLDAISKNEFQYEQGGIVIEFNDSKNELTLKQRGGFFPFVKEG